MNPGWRPATLAVALLATLAAAWFAPSSEEAGSPQRSDPAGPTSTGDEVVQAATPKPAPKARSASAVPEVMLLKRRDDDLDRQPERLFVARPWLPKPAASAASVPALPRPVAAASAPPAPPPLPGTPPLPFRVLGRYSDGGTAGVFLQVNNQNLVARVGDTLVDQYRVESISASTLTLRYLPLNETQTLDLGAPN